jgi:hypothetical protein
LTIVKIISFSLIVQLSASAAGWAVPSLPRHELALDELKTVAAKSGLDSPAHISYLAWLI